MWQYLKKRGLFLLLPPSCTIFAINRRYAVVMKKKDLKKKNIKLLAVNLLAMVFVVVALPYLILCWLDSYTHHGEAYAVPDICGMHLDEAKEVLRNNKLDFEIVEYKYKKGAAENEVIEQRPVANSKVKEGRKIMLTMNSTVKPVVSLPSIIDNCSLREAEARLKASGFVVANVVMQDGEKDWVYEVKLDGRSLVNGDNVPHGSKLVLIIGNGEESLLKDGVVDENYFE